MLEFFTTLHWPAVFQIVIIDILLGGDNAVVIALACRDLPASQRMRGVIWGTVGAIVLRVALIAFAVVLLDVPLLKFAGGLLLLWIGVRLVAPSQEGHANVKPADKLISAIKTIIVADAVMSLDNVIAIAAAAGDNTALLILGLAISIPLIVAGAALIMSLLDRFPILIWAGAALLGWIVGEVIATDPVVHSYLSANFAADMLHKIEIACGIVGAILVVAVGGLWRKSRLAAIEQHKVAAE